jgi:hypothetical protein
VKNTNTLIRAGASAWVPFGMRSGGTSMAAAGKAPNAQHEGTTVPFAGYTPALAVAAKALRTGDAKVPDPRGRWR